MCWQEIPSLSVSWPERTESTMHMPCLFSALWGWNTNFGAHTQSAGQNTTDSKAGLPPEAKTETPWSPVKSQESERAGNRILKGQSPTVQIWPGRGSRSVLSSLLSQ